MTFPKDAHDYAWKWFQYHAGQRLTAFRYYLVFLGILAVALNNGLEDQNYLFATIVAGLGAFVSVAFLFLEYRNEELVDVGRSALKAIEEDAGYPDKDELKLVTAALDRNDWVSHKRWLRWIYRVCIAAFVAAALYAAVFAPAADEPAVPDAPVGAPWQPLT